MKTTTTKTRYVIVPLINQDYHSLGKPISRPRKLILKKALNISSYKSSHFHSLFKICKILKCHKICISLDRN